MCPEYTKVCKNIGVPIDTPYRMTYITSIESQTTERKHHVQHIQSTSRPDRLPALRLCGAHYKLRLLCGAEMKPSLDVKVSDHGSIWLFRPLTVAAVEWIKDNVSEDRQWFGPSLAVGARYAEQLRDNMVDAGLAV